jgi:hypothetical protein
MSSAPPESVDWTNNQWYRFCLHNPDDVACETVPSYYNYRISIAPNAAFLALFSISLIGFIGTYAATRRGLSFAIAMGLGVICEIIGYAGRVVSWKNQWNENGFLIQICCLTIAPAFIAAGIYLSLRQIVHAFGAENSRIPPAYYTRIVGFVQDIFPTTSHVFSNTDALETCLVHPMRCDLSCSSSHWWWHGFSCIP